jgi:polysaccharide pyruvyl transferase WcaK-like protein
MKILQLGAKVGKGDGRGKGNAGDSALGTAFDNLFKEEFPGSQITFMNCRKIFTENDIEVINQHDILVVSGGGLFLYDTFENNESDWQWGISEELLEQISIPIIVYAIGYNKFRGQRDFNSKFDKTVKLLVEKSLFFSVRNSGSGNAIKKHIPEYLHKKISLNFCPTMLLNEKYKLKHQTANSVGFVLAGDRLSNRHKNIKQYSDEIKKFTDYLSKIGKKTILINHQKPAFLHQPNRLSFKTDTWLQNQIQFDDIIDLFQADTRKIYETYSNVDTVVCDRGHAQMIPFSLGCKILTPISHNKLKWFLDDMQLNEFGIEENDSELGNKLIKQYMLQQKLDWENIYTDRMNKIKQLYLKNMNFIKAQLSNLNLN